MTERLTVLQIAQRAMSSIGMAQPANLINSADDNARQLIECLNETAEEMQRRYDFQALKVEASFVTLAQEDQGDIYDKWPDFRRVVNDSAWNSTTNLKLRGPASPQKWKQDKATGEPTLGYDVFRIYQDHFYILNHATAGQTIELEYVSAHWIKSGLDRVGSITANSDVPLLNSDAMVHGVQMRWLQKNGQDSSAAAYAFEASLRTKMGEDGGKTMLSMRPQRLRDPRAVIVRNV